jgi:uncharacterized protein (DUF1697 family)
MGATQYVAFLRAVNVGGRVVKMTDLKRIFEAAGLDAVSTFIASGNVIFSSAASAKTLAPKIESALQKALGYAVTTMLRTTAELDAIAARTVFPAKAIGAGSVFVGLMQNTPSAAAVKKALALQTAVDSLRVDGREVFWLARNNFAEATISGADVEKALQTPVTFRNINTVRRLAAKLNGSSAPARAVRERP